MVERHTTRRALLAGLAGTMAIGAGCLDGDDGAPANETNGTNATVGSPTAALTADPVETTGPRPQGADRLAAAGTETAFPTFRYAGSNSATADEATELRAQPRRVWSHELPGETFAPIVSDGLVFAALKGYRDDQPSLFALAADTGRVVWSVDLGTAATGPPTLHRDTDGTRRLVVATRTGYLVALNPVTGEEDWRADVSNERALVPRPRLSDRIVSGGPERLVEVDVADGSERYSRSIDGEIAAPPATTESRIVVVTRAGDGNRDVVAINPLQDREDWRSTSVFAGPYAPVVRNGLVYVVGQRGVEARDVARGTQQWTQRASTAATPAVTSSLVVVRTDADVVALDASHGREQWRQTVGYAEDPPAPTIGGGTVYAGGYDTHRESMAIDLGSGRILWTAGLDSGWATTPPIPVDVGLFQGTGGSANKPYEIHAFTDWE
ncbi:outer membrane protein assembly factor BamB family protein [Halococcoides cellulosivorans]|nr:PQQ-binding-like beta-propeller repeat protein [Halococcoides cellulosivorans]